MTAQRYQRRRTKGWKMPANCVSVTRPGYLGNPFTGPDAVILFGEYAADHFRMGRNQFAEKWIGRIDGRYLDYGFDEFKFDLEDIAANELSVACFCGLDQRCHGDVILILADVIRQGTALPCGVSSVVSPAERWRRTQQVSRMQHSTPDTASTAAD